MHTVSSCIVYFIVYCFRSVLGPINFYHNLAFVYSYFRGGSGSELHAKGRELGSGPVSLDLEK